MRIGSSIVRIGLPVLALGGAMIGLVAVTSSRPESPVVPTRAVPPRQPEDRGAKGFVGASGVVEAASENIAIASPVAGLVVRVAVAPGELVEAGQLLFAVDAREAEAEKAVRRAEQQSIERQVATARADVAEAEANLADRTAQLARARAADVPGSVSGEELSQRRFAADAARARLARAVAEVARLRAEVARAGALVAQSEVALARLRVTAPTAGQVLRVNVRPGEFAPAAQVDPPLIVLGQTQPLHVRIDVDEADIPRLAMGAPASIQLRGAAMQPLRGRFVRAEPLVVPKSQLSGMGTERVDTRVLQLIYAFDPGGTRVYPGQQVDVFLPAARAPQGQP
jgi:multidrug efflux pump subunit AcrA (membrane-fusion protein)